MTAWRPLRLDPLLKPRLWGGTALRDRWGKALPSDEPYGESWELSWRSGDTNAIAGGPFGGQSLDDLAGESHAGLVGTDLAAMPQFPLLAKLLDCRQRLSVQVHPTSAYVETHPEAEVKMEAWYVLDAPADATLIFGLRDGVTRDTFAAAIAESCVPDTLQSRPVQRGDVLLVKPGTVHAILEGLMVYEIQQSSDTTFRVYDWDRVDAQGRSRELHVQQALECIAFDASPPGPIAPIALDAQRDLLVATPAFALERVRVSGEWRADIDARRCELLTAVEGEGAVDGLDGNVRPGDSILLPAALGAVQVRGDLTLLRAYLPDWQQDVWAASRAAGHGDDAIRAVCGGFGPDAVAA